MDSYNRWAIMEPASDEILKFLFDWNNIQSRFWTSNNLLSEVICLKFQCIFFVCYSLLLSCYVTAVALCVCVCVFPL